MAGKPKNLKKRLESFIDQIQELATVEKDAQLFQEESERLKEEYRKLYKDYENLTPDQEAALGLSSEEIKQIYCLQLGYHTKADLNILLKRLGENNPAVALAEFLKTEDGFKITNGSKGFDGIEDAELVVLFGSLFGVRFSEEIVRSLRAEEVGSIIGYALSGLVSQHIQEFKSLYPHSTLDSLDFTSYLSVKIAQSDVTTVYQFDEANATTFAQIHEDSSRIDDPTKIRSKGRLDHTFVNHETQKIIIGNSTSNDDMSIQRNTFIRNYQAMVLLTQEETLDSGQDNPYFAYEVESFYLMLGRFATTASVSADEKQKGRTFSKLMGGANVKEKEALSQLQFFSLVENTQSDFLAPILLSQNPFIAGCDTLDIYTWQQDFKKEVQAYIATNPNEEVVDNKRVFDAPMVERAKELLTEKLLEVSTETLKIICREDKKLQKKSKESLFTNYTGLLGQSIEDGLKIAQKAFELKATLPPATAKKLNKQQDNLKDVLKELASVFLYANQKHPNSDVVKTLEKIRQQTWMEMMTADFKADMNGFDFGPTEMPAFKNMQKTVVKSKKTPDSKKLEILRKTTSYMLKTMAFDILSEGLDQDIFGPPPPPKNKPKKATTPVLEDYQRRYFARKFAGIAATLDNLVEESDWLKLEEMKKTGEGKGSGYTTYNSYQFSYSALMNGSKAATAGRDYPGLKVLGAKASPTALVQTFIKLLEENHALLMKPGVDPESIKEFAEFIKTHEGVQHHLDEISKSYNDVTEADVFGENEEPISKGFEDVYKSFKGSFPTIKEAKPGSKTSKPK